MNQRYGRLARVGNVESAPLRRNTRQQQLLARQVSGAGRTAPRP